MTEINYGIDFNGKKKDVIKLLLSLNQDENFKVTKIDKNNLNIIYNGGYNGVYDLCSNIEILGIKNNIDERWFYWEFKLTNKIYEHEEIIVVDNLGYMLGFLDFFVDMFIKEIGIMQYNEIENY